MLNIDTFDTANASIFDQSVFFIDKMKGYLFKHCQLPKKIITAYYNEIFENTWFMLIPVTYRDIFLKTETCLLGSW